MGAFIEVKGLRHVYQAGEEKKEALAGVDLSVERGEFLAVLGANGSGKSTLARHLNGLLLPTEGSVTVAGLDTREADKKGELWRVRKACGMVFQNPDNQLIAAVVEDDVAFGPENLGVPAAEIRKRVASALASVGMEKMAARAPHLLSGGQKQRIAIAGALAMETAAIVLDEPTAMLDPKGREEVMRVLTRLHEERGLTIILITHFMEEAARADRVALMDEGRISFIGTPREAFSRTAELKRLGLKPPLAGELALRLRERGFKIKGDILTDEELILALKACKRPKQVN